MNPAKDIFKRAEQAARKGNLEYAIELYLQGLTLDPKAADERRKLHLVEAQQIELAGGNPHGGMKTKLQTAGTLAKVKKLKMQKRWEDAIVEIERAIRPQPRNVSLLFDLGEFLEHIEAGDAAIGTFEDVLACDKSHAESYRKLGQLYAAKPDSKKAIEAYEKLRMYKPDDKEASKAIRDLSAATLVKSIEDKKASSGDESFRVLLKSEEESSDLEKKSKVIRTDEDRVDAIRFKKDELRKEPTNSRLWRDLGSLYQDLRKLDHARAAFKKALEVNPHDLFAIDRLGSLEEVVYQHRVEAAEAALDAARENGGAVPELEEQLGAARSELREFRITEYARKVHAHPTDYELKLRYGESLLATGRFDEAIEQFQKAVKDPKLKVRAQNYMGRCFQKKGVHSLAVSQYTSALEALADADSDVAKDVRYNLATATEESGDLHAALGHFQSIMSTDIGFRDVSSRVDGLMKRLESQEANVDGSAAGG